MHYFYKKNNSNPQKQEYKNLMNFIELKFFRKKLGFS